MSGDYLTHVRDLPVEHQLHWVRTRVQQTIDDLNEIGEPDEVVIARLRAVVELVALVEGRDPGRETPKRLTARGFFEAQERSNAARRELGLD